jgi:hypothetical protein
MTTGEIERVYLTARNAISTLSAVGRGGSAEDMADLEHKLWALSMYADEGRVQAQKHKTPAAA